MGSWSRSRRGCATGTSDSLRWRGPVAFIDFFQVASADPPYLPRWTTLPSPLGFGCHWQSHPRQPPRQGERHCDRRGAFVGGGHLDDETEAERPGQPLEHLRGGGVLSRLQPGHPRLLRSQLRGGDLSLRQVVLDAVAKHGERDRPGERRALLVGLELRLLPELLLADLGGATLTGLRQGASSRQTVRDFPRLGEIELFMPRSICGSLGGHLASARV